MPPPPETLNCKSQIRHCFTVLLPVQTSWVVQWTSTWYWDELGETNDAWRNIAVQCLPRVGAANPPRRASQAALIRSIIGHAAIQVTSTCQYRHTDTQREKQTDRQTERSSSLDARRDRSHALYSPVTRTTSDICFALSVSDARTSRHLISCSTRLDIDVNSSTQNCNIWCFI